MKKILLKPTFILLIMLSTQPLFSQDYTELITEEYLRSEFTFQKSAKMKYSKCEEKTYMTCKYVWDIITTKSEKKDLKRAQNGLAPNGNKLVIIYAKATSPKDFERTWAMYKDAKTVEGVGQRAIFSQQRKQLSLITDKNLIMHVNVEMKRDPKKNIEASDVNKEHMISIAKHVLKQL